jgi:sporulation protein YlmC with PRC-barrel domain
MTAADPVSWKVIERGWDVTGSDGKKVGTVHEVVGDANIDIFTGLAVSPGLLKSSRFVPSERVKEIVDGRVTLDVDADSFERLDEHTEAPPSATIRADTTDLPPADE